MARLVFLNHTNQHCSIYQSGLSFYRCLEGYFDISYLECHSPQDVPPGYDAYLINYHYVATNWIRPEQISRLPGIKIAYVLETGQYDPFKLCPPVFDAYCIPYPDHRYRQENVFVLPRPLEEVADLPPYQDGPCPTIGTLGLGMGRNTPGIKVPERLATIAAGLGEAVIKPHFPSSINQYTRGAREAVERIRRAAPRGVTVTPSFGFFPDRADLIRWAAGNTINCFVYRKKTSVEGLSSAADDAIASGRPVLVNKDRSFRHIWGYAGWYPDVSLAEAIGSGKAATDRMRRAWSPAANREAFRAVLAALSLQT